MKCNPTGPLNAQIMVVGEAPGREEEEQGKPFVGASGQELTKMLHDAGIPREMCFLTNVARLRPEGNKIEHFFLDKKKTKPGPVIVEGIAELKREIASVKPNLVIALGGTAQWALTGHASVDTWRGSIFESSEAFGKVKVVSTYHPARILRQWDLRFITVQDLRRARGEAEYPEIRWPAWRFLLRPNFEDVMECLSSLQSIADREPIRLAVDKETRRGHIACLGIAWSRLEAICIPFMCIENPQGYWMPHEEFVIVKTIRTLLTHPNVKIVGQNFLYDMQYSAKFWGLAPTIYMDTMLAHHTCWPGLPKGLDFLGSMYCEFYQYWKDEGKEWDPEKVPEDRLWRYNCLDACYTYEASEQLDVTINKLKLRSQFEFQMVTFRNAFRAMLRGVNVNQALRNELTMELMTQVSERVRQAQHLAGRVLTGPKGGFSSKKLPEYFYDTLGLPEQKSRKTGKRTCDEEALLKLANKEPLIRRLVYAIVEARSLGTSVNVVRAPLDQDKRIRCSYNVAGTTTFRLSSSEDAFGNGTNLQNITAGGKSEETGLIFPNLRCLFIPDPGKIIVDLDLDRADLQVVAWEANDRDLKRQLRAGVDTHIFNGVQIIHSKDLPEDELVPTHPNYPEHRARYAKERQFGKVFTHATDYYGRPNTVAPTVGISVVQCELYQRRWLGAHPGIKEWWRRVEHSLATTRQVKNAFGNRIFFFDRVQELLPEALAWIPQSTIALVINRIWDNFEQHCTDSIEVLLQVHDSLTGQVRERDYLHTIRELVPHTRITIPYPDPLIIPTGFKVSSKSWGDVKDVKL